MEDMVKVETGFGRGVLGFVLKKILEGKFGVKFVDFEVSHFSIRRPADSKDIDFHISVCGQISKNYILKLIKERKDENS